MNPFALAPVDRAARVAAARASAAADAEPQSPLDLLAVAEPAAAAWIRTAQHTDQFARSLMIGLSRFGSLTPRQIEAANRSAARAAVPAPTVDASAVRNALQRALDGGLKNPKLRLGDVVFSLAKTGGKHPGAVYMKDREDGRYLGMIVGNRLDASGRCDVERMQSLVELLADPQGAAATYGRLMGLCSMCNRPLSDPESVRLGIGPICKTRFFG